MISNYPEPPCPEPMAVGYCSKCFSACFLCEETETAYYVGTSCDCVAKIKRGVSSINPFRAGIAIIFGLLGIFIGSELLRMILLSISGFTIIGWQQYFESAKKIDMEQYFEILKKDI